MSPTNLKVPPKLTLLCRGPGCDSGFPNVFGGLLCITGIRQGLSLLKKKDRRQFTGFLLLEEMHWESNIKVIYAVMYVIYTMYII